MELQSVLTTNTVLSNGTAPLLSHSLQCWYWSIHIHYNINGGANQTITTTSGPNPRSVTCSVPTATAGTFVYTITNLADIYCTNTVNEFSNCNCKCNYTGVDFSGLPSTISSNAACCNTYTNSCRWQHSLVLVLAEAHLIQR